MKKLMYLMLVTALVSSCYTFDFNKNNDKVDALPPMKTLGTISFTLDTLNYGNTGIEKPSKNIVLTVHSAAVSKGPFGYELRVLANNGLSGVDYKAVSVTIKGDQSGIREETSYNAWIYYSEGLTEEYQNYIIFNNMFTQIHVEDANIVGASSDCFVTTTSGTQTLRNPIFTQGSANVTLSDFKINVDGFGGNVLSPSDNAMIFSVNGKPAGSFNYCLNGLNGQIIETPWKEGAGCCLYGEPEPNSISVVFNEDEFNSTLKNLSFKFVKRDPSASFQKVGKIPLYDNSGFSELEIEAIGHDGKVYREQDGKGYVRVTSATGWSIINGTHYEGFVVYEFAFELISADGETLDITAGAAGFETRD